MFRGIGFVTAVLLVIAFSLAFAQSDTAVDIEGGFAYKNLEFAVLYPHEVLGTMINKSGRDYKSACFMMKLYNQSDQLLKTVNFCVSDFRKGQSKQFHTTIGTNPAALKGYKILFSSGK